jgi:hypothetical protein
VEKRTNGQPKSIRSHGAIDIGRRRRGDHPDVHSHGGGADAMKVINELRERLSTMEKQLNPLARKDN